MAHGTCWPCGLGPLLGFCHLGEVVKSSGGNMVEETQPLLGRRAKNGNSKRHRARVRDTKLQENRDKLGSCHSIILALETI